MAITINRATRVINVPQADLVSLGNNVYEFDVDAFSDSLKDLTAAEAGSPFPVPYDYTSSTVLEGETYAPFLVIINDYEVEFEDGQYTVKCIGANHNLASVKVENQVSLIINNSAGLIEKEVFPPMMKI